MSSSTRTRAGTSSPVSRASRDDPTRPHHRSPYRHNARNSSSTLAEDVGKLRLNEDRIWQLQLDEQSAEQERRHKEALEQALAEHERVRQNAEWARERVELELQRERKRREDEEFRKLEAERKALEAEQRAQADRDAAERRRLKEQLEREEQEQQRRAAEEREIHEAQARLAEQRRKDEAEAAERKRKQEEADRKASEEAAAAAAAAKPAPSIPQQPVQPANPIQPASVAPPQSTQPAAQPATQPTSQAVTTSATPASSLAQREALHKQYLALHKQLKEMRKYVVAECKKIPQLKSQLGDWRRKINLTVGQLTTNSDTNRLARKSILDILKAASSFTQPSVDVSSYLLSVPTDGTPKPMSGPLVYLLNIVAKVIIRQFISEASASPVIADPISMLAVTVFAMDAYKYNGTTSLIDIFLAKYHMCCPILWGIHGDEKTQSGRRRLGWAQQDGAYIPEQRHIERTRGLARGFASVTFRDFSKSQYQHPFPPANYWKALSYIVNTPPSELQTTHFVVLKGLVQGYETKFLSFYGQAAVVALRRALIELPPQAPKGPARDQVMGLPETMQKEIGLAL